MCDPGLKEVNKQAVNSTSDCTPQLILLLSKDLSFNPRGTTLSTSTDIFPIGNTDFFPQAIKVTRGPEVEKAVHQRMLSVFSFYLLSLLACLYGLQV